MGVQTMKYAVIAYPNEEGNKRREAIIEAEDYNQAQLKAWKKFPEHHEIGVFEMEGNR